MGGERGGKEEGRERVENIAGVSVNVSIIDDLYDSTSGYCLTEGSGFISVSLAKLLPRRVVQGHVLQWGEEKEERRKGSIPVPSVFQVRVYRLC